MPQPETKIGPYTLVNKIGEGQFGVVWLAERRASLATTRFALKLPKTIDADIEEIKQEAEVWMNASGHPNILPIIEAEIYDEQVVIVSEYAPDGSLSVWLKRHGGKRSVNRGCCRDVDAASSPAWNIFTSARSFTRPQA